MESKFLNLIIRHFKTAHKLTQMIKINTDYVEHIRELEYQWEGCQNIRISDKGEWILYLSGNNEKADRTI